MRFLLDTQSYLWYRGEPQRLRGDVADQLADAGNAVFFSAASSWEIAIKYSLGKLVLPENPETFVLGGFAKYGFEPLTIQHLHTLRAGGLPPHHKDPFDRLLIAQAQLEDLTIVTSDPLFDAYAVKVLRSI